MLSNCGAELTIDLKGERVKLVSFEAVESLGQPYVITVNVVAAVGDEIDLLPCLGNEASIDVSQDSEHLRYFHGIITDGQYIDTGTGGYQYRLTVRPRTWLMSHNCDYRIYQDISATDIIKQVFDRNGVNCHINLKRTTEKRVYCVQYRESDFDFVSRLMEEEGIYYYFEHRQNDHIMMVVDAPAAHQDGDPSHMTFNPDLEGQSVYDPAGHQGKSNYIYRWEEHVSSGAEGLVTLRDFNFEQTKVLQVQSLADASHTDDNLEVYEYPGEYMDNGAGTPLSRARLEALRAKRQYFSGHSLTPSLEVGTAFTMAEHTNDRYNRRFILSRIHTKMFNSAFQTGAEEEDGFTRFEVIRDDLQWRMLPLTPKPRVSGPETAIITGPEGEEIFTDKYGRVKVRFHWDRSGSKGEESTCWMRVSQTGGLGNIILPRVGHEVIVDFLDGNPDRPVVVGRVFNSEHMPIYPLPEHKTKALWRTKRYGDTGDYGGAMELDTKAPGVNELRFDDKGGHEEIFLHAERDMNTRIRHIETHHVGLDREIKIGGNETKDVKKDETISIHKNSILTIDEDNKVHIKGNKTVDIDKDETRKTKGNVKIETTGDHTETVKGNYKLEVTGTLKMKAMQMEIETDMGIIMKVGGNTVKIEPTGVTVEGLMVNVKANAMTQIEAPMTQVKGNGLLILKGGLTMIN